MPSRSQRHKVYIQGVASNGQTVAGGNPSGPPITDATLTPTTFTHATNVANSTTVGTLIPTGGTAPFNITLPTNPGGAYKMVANVVQTAIAGPHTQGAKSLAAFITDSRGQSFNKSFTITVT